MSRQRALPPSEVRVLHDSQPKSTTRVRLTVAAFGVLSLAAFGILAVGSGGGTPAAAATKADASKTGAPPTSEPDTDADLAITPPSDPPTDLGDDPALDELAQSCHDGDLLACDHLFLQSPVGSDYAEYGDTCAGRQPAGTESYCALGTDWTPGPEPEPNGTEVETTTAIDDTVTTAIDDTTTGEPAPPEGLGTDPELDALAESCYAGDMESCDDLYNAAEAGSDYEIYGDTCAGRQPEHTGQYCRFLDDVVPGTGLETTTTEIDDTVTTAIDDTVTTAIDDTTTGEPVPPEGLGTDPELDALAESCYAGDMEACDDLYFESELGSDYQIYGDTCAGRQPEGTGRVCTRLDNVVPGTGLDTTTTEFGDTTTTEFGDTTTTEFAAPTTAGPEPTTTVPAAPTTPPGTDITEPTVPGTVPPPTQEPTGLGTDPALDALAQSCYDGDLAACDELFRTAPADTPYRAYGDTCAGRQPPGSGLWCTVAFGDDTTTSEVTDDTTTVPVTPTAPPPPTEPATTLPITTPPPPPPPPTEPITTPPPPPTEPGTTEPGTTLVPLPPTTAVAAEIPPPTLEPTGLGDDPNLDALAQACYDGEMEACDELWEQSAPDSAYRNFGDTCAGRQPPNTGEWCTDSFPPGGPTTTTSTLPGETIPGTTVPIPPAGIPPATQQPTGLGDDPNLDALAQSCYSGDMQACDDLYDQAPIGSAYFEYGDTCAGRQPAKTFNYCRVTFPSDPRRP